MPSVTFDRDAARRKYAAERDKRVRSDGNQQYVRLGGEFEDYLTDPYTPFVERDPVTDHVTFAFIGAGFAGLLTGARLKEAGVEDVRIIDKAGDFGGTWYWNRYPGAMCDTASLVYMPLLEETGYMPTEKYAHGPEIWEHCRRIARQYGLYENALFHTSVTSLSWDETGCYWRIGTDRGDFFTAQFVGIGLGPLNVAKLPRLLGIRSFQGHAFHTSRWDYAYTGGTPVGRPLDKLTDKRVAIIGTGATAVQCVPEVARTARELYVFQRTPSSIDARDNGPIEPEWFKTIATPGWQKRWIENFTLNWEGVSGLTSEEIEDLVQDGWTDLGRRMRQALTGVPREELTPERLQEAYEAADFAKMDAIRSRVDALLDDPVTAANLKAWYRQLCKRPCFHDEYLQAFNRPNVHLIDTDGRGVERISSRGVVAAGKEYEIDLIIYATGFEYGTEFTGRAGFDMIGRRGIRLSEHWAKGIRTLHGLHVHNFPNAYFVQLAQGASLGSNVPHNFVDASQTIATVVSHAMKSASRVVEASEEDEHEWVSSLVPRSIGGGDECTPGYYNNEGMPLDPALNQALGYPKGPTAFFKLLDEWRNNGRFEGLVFE